MAVNIHILVITNEPGTTLNRLISCIHTCVIPLTTISDLFCYLYDSVSHELSRTVSATPD